jgi:SHS2 domain-containing protein
MAYRWVDHTAEVEIEIQAPTEEQVFLDAMQALAELVDDVGDGDPVTHEVEVSGEDRAALLAGWLDELVYLAEAQDMIPHGLPRIELSADGLSATVEFRTGRPRHLVKGATYHRLAFERASTGFRATVVLDV